MYFNIKKKTHLVILFLGICCIVWWGLVCKMTFNSFVHIPFLHFLPYFSFLSMIGFSIFGWIRVVLAEKNIAKALQIDNK